MDKPWYNLHMATQQVKNSSGSLTWLDINNPSEEDRALMMKLGNFTITDLEDALRKTQRTKIVKHKEYIYLVMTAPVYDEETRSIEVHEVDLFIGKDFVITVHHGNLPQLSEMIKRCTQIDSYRNRIMENGVEYLVYKIIETVQENTYPMIDYINDELDRLKHEIFGETHRSLISDILHVRQNITDMRTALRSHGSIISHLMKAGKDENVVHIVQQKARFGELIDYANELWGVLESSKEMVEALEDAHDALLSHNLNDTMKTLTSASVILLPASILAGMFGMNVKIPFTTFTQAGTTILLVSMILIAFFWRKGWLR